MKKPLIVLAGPTAVGKTELSITLAKKVNGEIISADSMQVYKYMDIGSAKISAEEMQGVPHYLIDEVDPAEEFSVALYKEKAEHYIDQVLQKGKIPILVGGTGFYIQSVIDDMQFSEADVDYELRDKFQQLAHQHGNDYLHERLQAVDPISAQNIHPNNVKRVIRALEVYEKTGTPLSSNEVFQNTHESKYNLCYFALTRDREILYQRINKRVDIMLEQGLIDEVKELMARGYNLPMVSMQGLGYKEIIMYLQGEISLEEAVYLIKRDSRRYAKRQLTWFRRDPRIVWINLDNDESIEVIVENMLKTIEAHGII